MNIETTIEFKSLPVHYVKESGGRKSNTVRVVSKEGDKIITERINEIRYIRIKNTNEVCYKESFVRELTDITRFIHNDTIMYIFSW
jgi:hypothetical protein